MSLSLGLPTGTVEDFLGGPLVTLTFPQDMVIGPANNPLDWEFYGDAHGYDDMFDGAWADARTLALIWYQWDWEVPPYTIDYLKQVNLLQTQTGYYYDVFANLPLTLIGAEKSTLLSMKGAEEFLAKAKKRKEELKP